jgi:gas vesicle protein
MNKLLFGVLAGFVAGILVAPEKGSDTRKKLRDAFRDLSENLINAGEDHLTEKPPVSMKATAKPDNPIS